MKLYQVWYLFWQRYYKLIQCTALWGYAPSVFAYNLKDNRDSKDKYPPHRCAGDILEKEVEKMKKIDYLLFNSAGFLGGFCGLGCFRLGFGCLVLSNLLVIGIRIS